MFESARLKLTAWYLVIIMCISIAFSMGIYRILSSELSRLERVQRLRIERGLNETDPRIFTTPIPANPELVDEASQRILWALVIINLGILVASSAIGYFLAGKTLEPIVLMLDEQNRFITDASHELRTPLTSLKSAMEVSLRDKKLTLNEAKQLIFENITEVDKLQSLSENLLELASYQKGENIKIERIPISSVLYASIAKVKALSIAKRIKIKLSVKNHKVAGNAKVLSDLFVIFLDNAIKYSNKGATIEVLEHKNDGTISVSISDNGVGIAESDIPHIFERFYRTDIARSKNASAGWGLGLSIAKSIVDSLGGSIKVKSTVAKGTTFTINLPVKS
ncbi:MAG TPA: HAMP domain-containing sensor histidine kinase [Candidatus Saccharimonadales bacterium]|nr:HAMP domain-containing sensor histidine kinase [Candidatus Saccharimonadales bacterium]